MFPPPQLSDRDSIKYLIELSSEEFGLEIFFMGKLMTMNSFFFFSRYRTSQFPISSCKGFSNLCLSRNLSISSGCQNFGHKVVL